jgi:type IV pilus assembly protein PilB
MVALNRLVKKKLGELLVEQGVVNAEQVQDALRLQHQSGKMLGEILVEQKFTTEDKIVDILVGQFGLPFLKPSSYTIAKDLLEIFDPAMMRRFQFVPVDSIGSTLVIAIAGAISEEMLREIETQTGCSVQLFITRMSEINSVLSKHGL